MKKPKTTIFRIFLIFMASAFVGNSIAGEAENAVRKILNDPGSARFSGVKPGVEKGDMCGFVNAKNRMGGYAGSQPFVYFKKEKSAILVPSPSGIDFKLLWLDVETKDPQMVLHYKQLQLRCMLALGWEKLCGTDYPDSVDQLCDAIKDGDIDVWVPALRARFDP